MIKYTLIGFLRKRFGRILTLVIIIIISLVIYYKYPLMVFHYGTDIKTPDSNNLIVKDIKYGAMVRNITNRTVAFQLNFKKKEKDREWYVYYDIIPDNYTSEVCYIGPGEVEIFQLKETINYETDKTISSLYNNMRVKYKIIK